jgi:hypothetical protein
MQKKNLFLIESNHFHWLLVLDIYIFVHKNIWSVLIKQKTKNAYQRERVLKDDIWQDLTEHESKLELVEDGIESEEEKI